MKKPSRPDHRRPSPQPAQPLMALMGLLMLVITGSISIMFFWHAWTSGDGVFLVFGLIFSLGIVVGGAIFLVALNPPPVYRRREVATFKPRRVAPRTVKTQPGQHLAVRLVPFAGDSREQIRHALITVAVAALPFTVVPLLGKALAGHWWLAPTPVLVLAGMLGISQARRFARLWTALRQGIETIVEVESAVVERGDKLGLYVEQHGTGAFARFEVALVCETRTWVKSGHFRLREAELYRKILADEPGLQLQLGRPWQKTVQLAIPHTMPLSGEDNLPIAVHWYIIATTRQHGDAPLVEHKFPITVTGVY